MSATPPTQFDPVLTAQLFFQRTKIKGAEVEAYVQAYNWLEDLKTGEFTALPTAVLPGIRLKSEEQAKTVVHLQDKIQSLKGQLAEYEIDEEAVPPDGTSPD